MVARGRVQNGVVVLDGDVHLPEGLEVIVLERGAVPDSPSHRVLEIPAVSLGPVLRPLTVDDDLLGEMLDGRP
jgi:hypothetical protein